VSGVSTYADQFDLISELGTVDSIPISQQVLRRCVEVKRPDVQDIGQGFESP
jgi:hypothetical protein